MHPCSPNETSDESRTASAAGNGTSSGTRPIVAIQGELGSFSDEAVTRYWKGTGIALPQIDCARVASAVGTGRATHGMLAMDNSIAGSVTEAHEALAAVRDRSSVGRG